MERGVAKVGGGLDDLEKQDDDRGVEGAKEVGKKAKLGGDSERVAAKEIEHYGADFGGLITGGEEVMELGIIESDDVQEADDGRGIRDGAGGRVGEGGDARDELGVRGGVPDGGIHEDEGYGEAMEDAELGQLKHGHQMAYSGQWIHNHRLLHLLTIICITHASLVCLLGIMYIHKLRSATKD
ncbi:hypothetical protein Cni_G00101 [Canna indica]|uniref:Uncharacterized protein n=1 Tax=Canna indica TaxID=4628 RepID=A0AAQ3PVZ5_9LILI|nr:hypothetical protein Cni_G00101 [Canna indica]